MNICKLCTVAGYVMGKHAKTPFCIEEQKVHVEIMPALTASSDSKKTMEEKILCVMVNLPNKLLHRYKLLFHVKCFHWR